MIMVVGIWGGSNRDGLVLGYILEVELKVGDFFVKGEIKDDFDIFGLSS